MAIAAGDWLGSETFYQAPLYPYFLGVLYALFGPDLLTVRLVQIVLGSASCVLLAVAGHRLFSRNAGIVAGLMLAVYAPAIFFDSLVQKSGLGLFLLCVALAVLSRLATGRPGPAREWVWLWPGVALGGLMLTRENAVIFVIAVLGWLALARPFGRRRLLFAGTLLVGLAVMILPVAIRNKVVGGELLLTTAQFGPNFYIGNNPDADGTYLGSTSVVTLNPLGVALASQDRLEEAVVQFHRVLDIDPDFVDAHANLALAGRSRAGDLPLSRDLANRSRLAGDPQRAGLHAGRDRRAGGGHRPLPAGGRARPGVCPRPRRSRQRTPARRQPHGGDRALPGGAPDRLRRPRPAGQTGRRAG